MITTRQIEKDQIVIINIRFEMDIYDLISTVGELFAEPGITREWGFIVQVDDTADILAIKEYGTALLAQLVKEYKSTCPQSRLAIVAASQKHPFLEWNLKAIDMPPDRFRIFLELEEAYDWMLQKKQVEIESEVSATNINM